MRICYFGYVPMPLGEPIPSRSIITKSRGAELGCSEKDLAMSVLERLRIISPVQEPATPRAWQLSNNFSKSLRQALTGGGTHRSFGIPSSTPDPNKVDVAFLDAHARHQWEAILQYMVSSTNVTAFGAGSDIVNTTKMLLQAGGLVEIRAGGRAAITKDGFTFLLQDANTQVWSLLIVYMEWADKQGGMDKVDVLSFLFMLGSLELGQDYSSASLTETQMQMLDDMMDFGIVYRPPNDTARFYPTRLATTLTSDAGALLSTSSTGSSSSSSATGHADQKGYIIVETNYRVYAYTSSTLQISTLALFCRLHTRFPNLISGKLTKESIQRAVGLGITADQIITYLTAYAHPQMLKHNPVLPPTVVDQIRLWQMEGDRMTAKPGYLVKDFANEREYEETKGYADNLGVLLWQNNQKRLLFVSQIEQLMSWFKARQERVRGSG